MPSPNAIVSFEDDSMDCAICLEELSTSKVITLQCGHRWHYHCIVEQIQTMSVARNASRRLLFTGCQCGKCGTICLDHPDLPANITRPTDRLRKKVDQLLLEQVQIDEPSGKWMQMIREEKKEKILDDARRKYAFYLCSHCKEPYFGGTIECADQVLDDDDSIVEPGQRLCVSCTPQTQTICTNPSQHAQYLIWKCRYCCVPAKYICYGNIHFCSSCHSKNTQRVQQSMDHRRHHRELCRDTQRRADVVQPPKLEPIPCPGGDKCCYPKPPGKTDHCNGSSPIDCEQVYYCAVCDSRSNNSRHRQGHNGVDEDEHRRPGSRNLIINPSGRLGLQGWKQLNPRMSWTVEQSELPYQNIPTNFVSSFMDCLMVQEINLSRLLRTSQQEQPPQPIRIEVSARYMARTDCPSVFAIDAMLVWVPVDTINTRTRRNNGINRLRLDHKTTNILEAPPDYWERATLELLYDISQQAEGHHLANGDLMLYVFIKGKDQRFWQGRFGSKVTNISVRILGTPEELDAILPTDFQQQQEDSFDRGSRTNVQGEDNDNIQAGQPRPRNHTDTRMRMVWDFIIPVLCFIIFLWLPKNREAVS